LVECATNSLFMSAKIYQQRAALVYKINKRQVRQTAAGAKGLAIFIGKENDRPVKQLFDFRSHNADHPPVPVFAAQN